MSDRNPSNRSAATELHPLVYWAIIGLCCWLVVSVWGFLGRGYSGLVLAVVSLFIAIAVGLPALLWQIWRHRAARYRDADGPKSFGEWLSGGFEASSGRQRSVDAAVEVLLPIAAVAIGMSTFALVLHLVV